MNNRIHVRPTLPDSDFPWRSVFFFYLIFAQKLFYTLDIKSLFEKEMQKENK